MSPILAWPSRYEAARAGWISSSAGRENRMDPDRLWNYYGENQQWQSAQLHEMEYDELPGDRDYLHNRHFESHLV